VNPLIRASGVYMKCPTFDFPEAKGKCVEELMVFDDAHRGREILIRFTDETLLSITMEVSTTVTSRLCSNHGGGMQTICERGDVHPAAVCKEPS
jgi:hypothetical protein